MRTSEFVCESSELTVLHRFYSPTCARDFSLVLRSPIDVAKSYRALIRQPIASDIGGWSSGPPKTATRSRYLVDNGQMVAKAYGATCTFHVLVPNRDRRLRHQGRSDDARIAVSHR